MDMWNAIRAEGKRLFRYRFFVFLLFLLLTGNILWFSLSHSLGWGNEKIKAGEYRQLAEEIRTGRVTGADMEQAIEEIFAKLWEYIPKYSDDYRSEYALYDLLLKEVSETDGYGAVLDGIVGNVRQVGNGLIKDNGYLYKRNQKIYRTYGRLSAENVGFLGSYGIRAAMSFDIWDVSVLLLMVMIVYYMFLYDGELQRYGLLFSHAFSKKKLFAARFLLSLLVCGTVLLFGYLIRLLLSQYLYGRMDFSAPVQCVYGASYAVMTLSVGGFFLLFLAGKLLLFFLLLSLFALVAVCVRKRSFYFVLLSMLFGVSYLLYRYIDGNSNLIMLRQINLLTFLHTDEVFLAYDMVRLLNSPVDLLTVFWTTCAVGGILFTVAAMQLFPKLNRKNSRFLTEYRTYTKRHLLSYEWKKLLFCGRGLAVILLFAGISLYLYQPAHERLSNKDEIYYKYYVKKAEGGEIEEKLSYLLEEESRLNEMEQKISGSEYIHESVLTYYGEQLKRKPGLLAALTYAQASVARGGSIVYGKGYEQLLGLDRTDGVLLFRVILMIIMMVVLSDILWFTDEETKMSRLIASTPRYKSVERHKLFIGFIMAFCAWAVCLLPFIAGIRQTFGLEYICAPACSLDALSGWTGLRILDVAAAFHFGMILYCFLVSLLTKYIGRCTKNYALVSAVTFVLSAILPVIFLGQ